MGLSPISGRSSSISTRKTHKETDIYEIDCKTKRKNLLSNYYKDYHYSRCNSNRKIKSEGQYVNSVSESVIYLKIRNLSQKRKQQLRKWWLYNTTKLKCLWFKLITDKILRQVGILVLNAHKQAKRIYTKCIKAFLNSTLIEVTFWFDVLFLKILIGFKY